MRWNAKLHPNDMNHAFGPQTNLLAFRCSLMREHFHRDILPHSKVVLLWNLSHIPSKRSNTIYLPKPRNLCEGNHAAQLRFFYITDTLSTWARIRRYYPSVGESSLQSQTNSAAIHAGAETCQDRLQEVRVSRPSLPPKFATFEQVTSATSFSPDQPVRRRYPGLTHNITTQPQEPREYPHRCFTLTLNYPKSREYSAEKNHGLWP